MMRVFQCPHCNVRVQCEVKSGGEIIRCGSCRRTFLSTAPAQAPASAISGGGMAFCPECGEQNRSDTAHCGRCGFILSDHRQQEEAFRYEKGVGRFIPYKNTPAILAYYFGIFSLMPCLGMLLAIPAIVLGIIGLKYAGKHPQVRGKGHAWTGVILGVFCLMGHIVLLMVSIYL